jgi:hypothetical protein
MSEESSESPELLEFFKSGTLSRIGSIMSLFASVYIFITWLLIRDLRKNSIFKHLIFLVIGYFVFATNDLIQVFLPDTDLVCEIGAAAAQFSKLSSFFWTAMFSRTLHATFVDDPNFMPSLRGLIMCCIIIPLISAIIPFFFGGYGYWMIIFCEGSTQKEWVSCLLYIIIYFIPFILLSGYSVVQNVRTINHLRNYLKQTYSFYQLLMYPSVVVVCNTFMIVANFLDYPGNDFDMIMTLIGEFLFTSQGFFDGMVYAFAKVVRHAIWDKIKDVCTGAAELNAGPVSMARFQTKDLLLKESSKKSASIVHQEPQTQAHTSVMIVHSGSHDKLVK